MEDIQKTTLMTSFMLVFSFVYRQLGVLFVILCLLMLMDYITGYTAAFLQHEQSSRIGILGILKKMGYIMLVVTAMLFDLLSIHVTNQLHMNIPFPGMFGMIVVCWLISNEGLSIVENLEKMGVPHPPFIQRAIERFRDMFVKEGEENDDENDSD